MDFHLTDANGEFTFTAVTPAARQFLEARMDRSVVGFSVDPHHFPSAFRAITEANLTVYMK